MPDQNLPTSAPTRPPFSARLRARIDAFLAKTGMSPTHFGRLVLNDSSLYTRIKRGRPITSDTIDLIENLMRTYKPPKKNASGIARGKVKLPTGKE